MQGRFLFSDTLLRPGTSEDFLFSSSPRPLLPDCRRREQTRRRRDGERRAGLLPWGPFLRTVPWVSSVKGGSRPRNLPRTPTPLPRRRPETEGRSPAPACVSARHPLEVSSRGSSSLGRGRCGGATPRLRGGPAKRLRNSGGTEGVCYTGRSSRFLLLFPHLRLSPPLPLPLSRNRFGKVL